MRIKGLRLGKGNSSLSRLLKRKYYIGILEVKGQVFQGIHPPIIPIKLFNQVQAVLERRYIPKQTLNPYKFTNVINCGLCGKKLRTMTAKKRYHYYSCRNKKCQTKCIIEEKVENSILKKLEEIKFTHDEIEKMTILAVESRQSVKLLLQGKRVSLKLQLDNAISNISKLVDLRLQGSINDEIFNLKNSELLMKKQLIESEINELIKIKKEGQDEMGELIKLLTNPLLCYEMANHDNKAQLIQKMMKSITYSPSGLNFEWQTPFLLISKRKNASFQEAFPISSP